jgi:hypothetical protein
LNYESRITIYESRISIFKLRFSSQTLIHSSCSFLGVKQLYCFSPGIAFSPCIVKKWNQAWKQRYSYLFLCRDLSRKEVFQPHLPVRLPCYDLAPVTSFTLGSSLRLPTSGTPSFHGLTGGVYKARERIHRAMADARLLAIPASRSRVADFDPN